METRSKAFNKPRGFRKTLLASSISSLLIAPALVQAQDEPMLEEIVVTGVYASQLNAVNTKRDAASVVDAISAEDIGKLPDVTIADSLQRIPGIQVERTAGEGGPVQIRGLANVATSLNGETFLSATTIDSSGADFGDLPSQLFSGADVYKSPLATLSTLGISGTVDLKTRRPFDLDNGWTFSGSAEVDQGSISEETDPTVSGLVGWTNDNVGFLVSAVTTEKNLSSNFNGWNDTSENGGNLGWHNNNHTYWGIGPATPYDFYYTVPHGVTAFNKAEERHRDGLNLSFQAELADGVELVVDHFYSKQERWNRRAGFNHNSRWQGFNHYALPVEEGLTEDRFEYEGNSWATTTMYDLNPYRMQSFTQTNYNLEESNNSSAELNFDMGGALTGQVRLTRASADAQMRHGYIEGDLLSIDQGSLVTGPGGLRPAGDCTGDNAIPGEPVGEDGGCFIQFSPNGIETNDFQIRYDASGEHPAFSGFDQTVDGGLGEQSVADYMADISAYHVGAGSSEGNTDDEATMNTFSTRWNYAFDDQPFGITSVDVGLRQSERFVDHEVFSYFAEFEDTGCQAQWKAVDQFAGTAECDPDLQQGEFLVDENGDPVLDENGDQEYAPYTLIPPMTLDQNADVVWIDDFGPVSGIPGVWAVDPRELDDTLAFQERVFGEQIKYEQPGETYSVGLNEFSYFTQVNFNYDDFVTGNLGVKVIETDLTVVQNEVGAQVPHSGVSYDTGDVVTRRSYTDVLPSLNVAINATDDVIVRLGYGETMQPLNLMDWGGAKRVGRTFNDDCQCMRVVDGSLNGNPELDPTRAKNYDLSAEWYLGDASMVSAAMYRIEIDSFVQTDTIMLDEPDSDGINRGPWPFSALVQGTGGEVNGFELAAKVAFGDLTDGFLSDFGFDVNYTLSESSQDATGLAGKELPFPNNSEDTYNIVGWYENDRLSARLAYNFRSPRLIAIGGAATLAEQALYQDDYGQLDLNVTYDITDQWSVYLNGANINEEYQDTYLEFEDQKVFQNIYEARWALGARFTY
ncbi:MULTISPECIES: TonB-dependent receptor [unclassified Marinimicrobium]|jgi:TonB-dependent receptor|uniref:TonB-dependent receptor n=2 Tax=Cellvibrionaceae TaxID=1706371 RepID=UPI00046365D8|nr:MULTISPECIES: TonB-dependent receptor [unclassified Marinimicrobium]MAN53308.1 TonB-dependent receptor [Marinimicrobium sp.]